PTDGTTALDSATVLIFAGVERCSSCRGLSKGAHTSGKHQPEEAARGRLLQPVAACTRAQSARRSSGLTAMVGDSRHEYRTETGETVCRRGHPAAGTNIVTRGGGRAVARHARADRRGVASD